uniref:Flavin-containing monooxygenase n=1 Tax=Oryza nivara TaxID=4536 RepID=A0A0E0GH55_ORYNI
MPLGRTGERLERDPHPELIEVAK